MEYAGNRDAQNGTRKNNTKALPRDDSSFESLPYEVPYRADEVYGAGDKSRRKKAEKNLILPVSPRKTRVIFHPPKF